MDSLSIDGFVSELARAERSQGRLSVAALTTSCCAAQLEAQCREVLGFRAEGPGASDVTALIDRLQRVRERLSRHLHQVVEVERSATAARELPDGSLDDRLVKQAAREETATGLLLGSLEAAALIGVVAGLGRQVHTLRREIRGGTVNAETTSMLLGAASTCVLYVLERSLRSSRSRDRAIHARGARATQRLRMLCFLEPPADEPRRVHAVDRDLSRLN